MPFDAREAKLLQPGQHITLQEHPGLRLVATATRRSWIYRYKSPVDGGMRQVKLGGWPTMDYARAIIEWEKRRGERDSGVDLQLRKRSERRQQAQQVLVEGPKAYTVADLVEDYLTGHIEVRRKPRGRAEIRRLLETHLAPLADRPAALLMRSEAYDLLAAMVDRPVIMAQVRQEMGAAYDYGLDSGRLPEHTANWWRQVWRGKMPRSKGKKIAGKHIGATKRVLSDEEIGVLLNWMRNFSKLVQEVLTLYLWTGARGGEICGMEKSEITEEPSGTWWTVPKEKTKNARHASASDLRVPLVGRARTIVLGRCATATKYLFPASVVSEDGSELPIEQKVVQGAVYHAQPYCTTKDRITAKPRPRLPVTHWAPHDLRRTVRTQLAIMGCPTEVAEAVLGHMLPGIVGVYNRHQYDAERLMWLTRLGERFEELAARALSS